MRRPHETRDTDGRQVTGGGVRDCPERWERTRFPMSIIFTLDLLADIAIPFENDAERRACVEILKNTVEKLKTHPIVEKEDEKVKGSGKTPGGIKTEVRGKVIYPAVWARKEREK